MDYILKDTQLFDVIYKYINSDFESHGIYWQWDDDYEGRIAMFYDDRSLTDDSVICLFDHINRKYYLDLLKTGDEYSDFVNEWLESAPVLIVRDKRFMERMSNLFGEHWKSPFQKWFKDVYGNKIGRAHV